jgi:hypothetical protein
MVMNDGSQFIKAQFNFVGFAADFMFESDLSNVILFIGEEPDAFAAFAFPPDVSGIGMVSDEGTPSGAVDTLHAGRFRARWE